MAAAEGFTCPNGKAEKTLYDEVVHVSSQRTECSSSLLKTPTSYPNHKCLGLEHPAACLGLHGPVGGLCGTAWAVFLCHGELQRAVS